MHPMVRIVPMMFDIAGMQWQNHELLQEKSLRTGTMGRLLSFAAILLRLTSHLKGAAAQLVFRC